MNTHATSIFALVLGAIALVALALLPACASDPSSPRAEQSPAPLDLAPLVGEWRLETIDSYAALPAGARAPTLKIDPDGRVSGFSGVNRMNGALDEDERALGRFVLGPVASTRMAGPPEAMALEQRFLTLLAGATAARTLGDTLTLSDPNADLLVFRRAQ